MDSILVLPGELALSAEQRQHFSYVNPPHDEVVQLEI
jgi:hypothetical protein